MLIGPKNAVNFSCAVIPQEVKNSKGKHADGLFFFKEKTSARLSPTALLVAFFRKLAYLKVQEEYL